MDIARIRCTVPGCSNAILPATAARTGGICARCENTRLKIGREEYIRKNRREVDPFEGVTDPVEIIRILQTPRKHDPLITYKDHPSSEEDLYALLTPQDLDRLVQIAIDAKMKEPDLLAENIAAATAKFTDHNLDYLLTEWISARCFRPAVIFRTAGPSIRDRLIHFVERWSGERWQSLELNHALCALAWVDDPVVHSTFARWEASPPPWRKVLHVGPGNYAHGAGWELCKNGARRLIYDDCLAIKVSKSETPETAVTAFRQSNGQCPCCSRPLVTMIDIDLSDSRFGFIGCDAPRLPVITCEVCICFSEHIFGKINEDGRASWHPKNSTPRTQPKDGESWESSPWQTASISVVPRRKMLAVEQGAGVSGSQIGGHPSWVQDAAYPRCPECARTMLFVAQIDNDDMPYHEGCYYAFLCPPCRTTATCYQQT